MSRRARYVFAVHAASGMTIDQMGKSSSRIVAVAWTH